MKGLILAGGSGTRLHPMTKSVSKQLLPVWDKPLVYYPLSTLMLAGIREILVISTPQDVDRFRMLLGDGTHLGLRIDYAVQQAPGGIAQAFLIGRDFIGDDAVTLILGDNLFYGHGLIRYLDKAVNRRSGATVFGYQVQTPERYGVLGFDAKGRAVSLDEKPSKPKSDWAVTGLYVYDNAVLDVATKLKPSARGELEITDVNRSYLKKGALHVEKLGRGIAWLDTGTPESLLQASNFIQVLEARQGLKVACPEEIAFKNGFISAGELRRVIAQIQNPDYASYLERVLKRVE